MGKFDFQKLQPKKKKDKHLYQKVKQQYRNSEVQKGVHIVKNNKK